MSERTEYKPGEFCWVDLATTDVDAATEFYGDLLGVDADEEGIREIAGAINDRGGMDAVNLRIAEQYLGVFGKLAKTNNTIILPTNVADIAGMIATAMSVVKSTPLRGTGR